jgi:hypothetical protein
MSEDRLVKQHRRWFRQFYCEESRAAKADLSF